jgi:two-component system, chemotaxis family, CheB/CheR fusion protein
MDETRPQSPEVKPVADAPDRQPSGQPDREAMPVDAEQPPRLAFPVVGVGASAGGLEAFSEFISVMRPDSGMAFVFILHLPPEHPSMLAEILSRRTTMPVRQVEDGLAVERNHVYVIRPGHVLTIENGVFRLGPELGGPRAANRPVDDFFKSLAEEQRERAICVLMSGMGSNGTAGAQAIKAVGGLCVAQDPESCQFPSMPRHLIDQGYADCILRPADIPDALIAYAGHPYARGGREADAEAMLKRSQRHVREILAILRTRTRQDFNGYKKPTVLRRIQRRMGLARITNMGEFANLLRQSPSEASALSDDLLIHVTGFFRDPAAWEALRQRVIVPLIAAREHDAEVRAWVTACSSGEEAYSLAMLLAEEADRAGKQLDIKVFATDIADRTLSHARAGTFPGGIEAEITPERLARFFEKDDSIYRVRQELRERVVFAPQNVLQDPPFSRLDVVTCRNLLIYLEPEVQQRVLSLLHFGLREGGALFLGTSETVGGADDLFEPIDKAARIFRRVGPTRHGQVDFPLPHAIRAARAGRGDGDDGAAPDERQRSKPRVSLAQMTQRTLLEQHTPAAVTVDRDHRIVYYHGNTHPFLQQPAGDPSRDLMVLARDGVRGAVRAALHRAAAENARATMLDGWLEVEPGRRIPLVITASPLTAGAETENGAADYFVVSFERREVAPAQPAGSSAGNGNGAEMSGELRRVGDELQSTIEELQTSNEELRASHEEVVSMNEELQSSNEELETSKEEMQSLNEELTTVNAQLRAKMEEHQAASSDLQSLLTSTDIAVLFLDPRFHIRRFTPPMRGLLDLIASDIGRPLSALARKFEDPELLPDAEAVLERLVPSEREVAAEGGRWFLRRITPYRTADNRIDGVVVTFVDITARRLSEQAMRASEEQFRRSIEDAPIPVIIQADDGQVLQVSRMWTELTGYTLADVPTADAWLTHAYGPGADQVRGQVHDLFSGNRKTLDLEFSIRTRGGSNRHWSFSASAPGTLNDGRRFMVGMAVDITDRQSAQEGARDSQERLRLALFAARMGTWTWEVGGDLQTRDENLNRLLGLEPVRTTQPLEEFFGHIHPDDVPAVRAAFGTSVCDGRPLNTEFRVLWPDGTVRWLRDQGEVFPKQDAPYMAGACIDVTERRQAETALRESEERLRLVVEGARDFAMLLLDRTGRITAWNAGAERLLGFTESEAVGQNTAIIFTPEDRASGAPEQELAHAAAAGHAADERWHVRQDGSPFWGSGVMTPLRNLDGSVRGFVKVLRDETARKEAEDATRSAKEAAELANRMKDDFLATLSHELRTPLGAILLWANLLRQGDLQGDDHEQALEAILSSAEAQRRLIEDMLDTSRLMSGKLRLDMRQMELDAPVAAAVGAVHPMADARGVRVDLELHRPAGPVMADPDRLQQIVWNLLNNAVKFTGRGGSVAVTVRNAHAFAEVRVADTGQGISPKFLPHMFERFRQEDASTTRAHAGLGLGLAICRELVELHGGTIAAESAGEGRGAVFTVRLPLCDVPTTNAEGSLPSSPAPHAFTPSAALRGLKVLLVEDEAHTRTALQWLLQECGADVTAADSADAAAAAFRASDAQAFDLIVSDLGMPGRDGYDLLGELREVERERGRARPTPALALTAYARDEDRKRALAAGFQSYLSKPAQPADLARALADLAGRAS